MPTQGHKDTTCSSVTLYDDGGPNGTYATRANSTWTFHTTQVGSVYRIVLYDEMCCRNRGQAYFGVYNGVTTNDNRRIYTSEYCWGHRIYYSDTCVVTIQFTSDDDDPCQGFLVEMCEAGGQQAQNVWTRRVGHDSIMVGWDHQPGVTWTVRWTSDYNYNDPTYAMSDTNIVYHYETTTSDSVLIISSNTINFDIYPSNLSTPCGWGYLGGACPCIPVEDLQRSYEADGIHYSWRRNAQWWDIIPFGDWNYVRVTDTFYVLPYDCDRGDESWFMVNGGECTGEQPRCNDWWDWHYNAPVHPASETSYGQATDSSLIVMWRDWEVDSCVSYIVAYHDSRLPQDSIIYWDTIAWIDFADTMFGHYVGDWWDKFFTDTITGLDPHTTYRVYIYTQACNQALSCPRQREMATTKDACIDYINVRDLDRVHLTWGTYEDPYRSDTMPWNRYDYNRPDAWGNWWFWNLDRHQPITDTNAYDWRTNWQLRQIPPGETASMRLGNDNVGAEGESITYDFNDIDSNLFDLLILEYALVMQNPDHTPENQPHFTLELLDEHGVLMDSVCCYADFVSGSNTSGQGWHTESDGITQWKDWTTIGIDIAPYHGSDIKVRLTNKDCAEGGHFSYAYFAMHCDNKRIVLINKCDSANFIHMQAPIGFEYQWWRKNDPNHTILGTGYDQLVPIDTNVYVCRCSFVGKPSCYFELECVSINVTPVPRLSYWVDTCAKAAYLVNESFLNFDTSYLAYTSQCVDSIYWRFDDGSLHWGDTVQLPFTENRRYEPVLVSRLSESQCIDSIAQPIEVNFVYQMQVAGPTDLCQGEPVNLTAQVRPVNSPTFHWSTGVADSSLTLSQPVGTQTYQVLVTNEGCTDTLRHTVAMHPTYDDTIHATICQDQRYQQLGFNQTQAGVYTLTLRSRYQCDSLSTLDLRVQQWRDTTFDAVLCHGYYYEFGGYRYTTEGTHRDTVLTTIGCDSIRFVLNLEVPASIFWSDTMVCAGESVVFGDRVLSHPGEYTQVFTNQVGCDSTVVLDLTVHYTFHGVIHDTICAGDQAWFEGQWIDTAGSYTVHLSTPDGCDSVRTLELAVKSTSFTPLDTTLCRGQRLAVGWHSYGETGLYRDTLCNTMECDSVVELHLQVTPPRRDTVQASICPGEEYPWAGTTYWETGSYLALGRDAEGCDTLTELLLTVLPDYRDTIVITLAPEDTTYELGTYVTHLYTTYGCDSIIVLVVEATEPVGIDPAAPTLRVFPNPTSGELSIESGALSIISIEIYDLHGRLIESPEPSNSQLSILNYPAGMYLIRVRTAEGVFAFRVIKQ